MKRKICQCGYETYDLESCKQKECPRYKRVEYEKANEQFDLRVQFLKEALLQRIMGEERNINESKSI